MRTVRPAVTASMIALVACGGGGATDPARSGDTTNAPSRTMSATVNGVAFTPTLLTSNYLSGNVGVNAVAGSNSFSINAVNVTATGTISVASGNPNSALVQWLDDVNTYSSGYGGSTGTVTFTILKLGRVAGSFNVTARTSSASSNAVVALVGTFDIPYP